ncbi:SGNH/GDSL hydrolase family protein [Terrabacter sp. NPDC000476]|uniref:SGNH/GDSL hydrolase family protein n=1 Tax=Terrabacter sp. NPDC000476 TaxID=3154258 RepID=UPI0033344DF7
MRRSRGRDLALGVAAVLANVLLVLGVVALATGRFSQSSGTPPTATTSRPATTAPTTPSPSPSTPTSTTPTAPTISTLLGSGRDATLVVLGDGTGDEAGEWVSAFAEQAGDTHRVTLRGLDPNDPTQYASKEKVGSAGPALTIWNGSRTGATADYPAKRLEFLGPRTPDAVLLSFGRDDTASGITAGLESTYRAVTARWPGAAVGVVLQGQDRDDAIGPVRTATRDWADSHGLPTIDVAAAFSAAGDPNAFVSVVDPPSTNAKGGRLWARTVLTALGGVAP